VRNRGTIGGSISNNDPAADYPAALVALNATVHTTKREISADSFFTGMFETALELAEIVTLVRFPKLPRPTYQKFKNPASSYAIVGVFVARTPAGVRVAVTGAVPACSGCRRWKRHWHKTSPQTRSRTSPSHTTASIPTFTRQSNTAPISLASWPAAAVAACA
jgi:CO/xanthine dehydrogenase FAD-binding subunit